MEAIDELAAALNGREFEAEDQPQGEGTPTEKPAAQEQPIEEEPTSAEKPAKSEEPAPQAPSEEDETQPVVDEEGKHYVPESRFKKETARFREEERKRKALEEQLRSYQQPVYSPQVGNQNKPAPADRTAALETELLYSQYPQFNPDSTDFNADLDETALSIYLSGRASTKVDAARQALKLAAKLQSQVTSIRDEAKTIKKSVTESGFVAKGGQRPEPTPDVDKMSADELEGLLRSSGNWGTLPK